MDNQNPKVFIVDDEPLLSEMLTDYLLNHHPNLFITSFLTGEDIQSLYYNLGVNC